MLVNFNIKDPWSGTMLSILSVNAFYQILEYTCNTIEQGMSNVPIILETMCHPTNIIMPYSNLITDIASTLERLI